MDFSRILEISKILKFSDFFKIFQKFGKTLKFSKIPIFGKIPKFGKIPELANIGGPKSAILKAFGGWPGRAGPGRVGPGRAGTIPLFVLILNNERFAPKLLHFPYQVPIQKKPNYRRLGDPVLLRPDQHPSQQHYSCAIAGL